MATRTNPLVTAATLASAAAIAFASPAVTPSLNLPTPHALSAAKVQLANFADVMSVFAAPAALSDILFGNTSWGGVLGPENYGADSAKPQDAFGQYGYVNPWAAYCNYNCDVSGPSGVTYLLADALVNGNGSGYANSDQWSTGIVNYLWEPNTYFLLGSGASPTIQRVFEGYSASTWYALQTTIGQAVPGLTIPLAAAYWGPNNVSVFYNLALVAVAGIAGQVPGVGPFVGNSILAYLGDLSLEQGTQDTYQYGLSGALNYWVDLASGAVPWPTTVPWYTIPAAAAVAPAAKVAATAAVTTVDTVSTETVSAVDSPESTPAAETPKSTPAVEAPESTPVADNTPAVEAPESTPAVETPAVETVDSTPAVEAPESTSAVEAPAVEAVESTPEVEAPEVKVADSTPAVAETKPVEAPEVSVPDVKDITPAADVAANTRATAKAPAAVKHPVRDAVEKVSKQINSAINGAKAGSAKAGSADSAS